MIFTKRKIIGTFVCIFTLGFILSVVLPILLRLTAHDYYSYGVIFIYLFISTSLEFSFWLKSRKYLNKFSLFEKDLQREIFINDAINLISGALARYDIYADVTFVLITLCWGFRRIFYVSLLFLLIKFSFKCSEFVKTFYKLLMAFKENKSSIQIWNLIAKLAIACEFLLMGDILDRYCPGNAKKIKRFFCVKLREPKFISMGFLSIVIKFLFEDIPQTVIQIVFYLTKDTISEENRYFAKQTDSFCFMSKPDDKNALKKGEYTDDPYVNFYLTLNIIRCVASLLASFYSFASIRQSYIEQSDFDERIEDQRLRNSMEKIQKNKKSVMKQRIYSLKSSGDLSKSVKDRMTLMTSKYLENVVKKETSGENKIGVKKEEEEIEDFVNLAVNSIDSKDIEMQEIDFMDSRVRLKKYFDEELL